jgi:Transposase IS66 family
MLDDLDLTGITDEGHRELVLRLLNLIETLATDLRTAQAEIQRLRDENNRLKGEQGQPTIKPGAKPITPDHSSEPERRQHKSRKKGRKVQQVRIDRERVLRVDPASLPPDAEFKGYQEVVVQDVVVHTDNVLFRKEKFYSPSQGKTYLAELPPGYQGEFGPGVRAMAIIFAFACQMTEPKILEWFCQMGIHISAGQISNLLIKGQQQFHREKDAVYQAGLASSPWHHLDDTATRVNGQNQHCHVVNNPLYTTYFTTPGKDRLSVIDVLRNGQPRVFRLNAEALRYLETAGVSPTIRQQLAQLSPEQDLDQSTLEQLLGEHLPDLGVQKRKWILDAAAVAAYHAQREWPVVRLLICDGAPQFAWVSEELGLCWVHEGRHYKKLYPYLAPHQRLLEEFLEDFWDFYRELLAYQRQPGAEERRRLETEFDDLFARNTGYWDLDERIALTRGKKPQLLMALKHPEIPLHNNPAELAVRQRVRKRKISFGTRVAEGTKAWDTFMSLAATTRKLGLNFYHYIHDRVSAKKGIPQLSSIIAARAKAIDLGPSWNVAWR